MLFIPAAISKEPPLFILSGMFASRHCSSLTFFFSPSVFLILDVLIQTEQGIPGAEAFWEALISEIDCNPNPCVASHLSDGEFHL